MKKTNEFARWVLEQSFNGCHIDGGDAQEKAHELGLLKVELFDPKIHGEHNCLEKGDDIYLFTDLISENNKGDI